MDYIMKRLIKKKICREGKQICPICDQQEILVEHHIRGRKLLNANKMFNLLYVCPNCHQKIHYGQIIIEGYFMTTNGMKLIWHNEGEESLTGDDAKPHLF